MNENMNWFPDRLTNNKTGKIITLLEENIFKFLRNI